MVEQFGPYRLEDVIGRGGMGVVYRAQDTRRDRTVALKRLLRDVAQDENFQARFRRESRIVARLNEPHIIPIHDFGEIDGQLFIDMRLVEGTDLAALIAARPRSLSPQFAVDVINQVAAALHAAHTAGLMHRDVKPSNILLTGLNPSPDDPDTAFAYLVDFGIARGLPGSGGTALTSTTGTVGTVGYMAPERISGTTGDQRSDVYSLACVLYECLTGHTPFRGEPFQVMFAHVNTPPPSAAAEGSAAPIALDDVIRRAMAKDPQDRHQTAAEFAMAARSALARSTDTTDPIGSGDTRKVRPSPLVPPQPAPPSGPVGVPPTRVRRRSVLLAVALLVLAGAGVAIALALSGQSGTSKPPAQGSNTSPTGSTSTQPSTHVTTPSAPPQPFSSRALYVYARPFFAPAQCEANPSAQDAPVAQRLHRVELIKCSKGRYDATFWRAETIADLDFDKRLFQQFALPGTIRTLTGAPFQSSEPATIQFSFLHVGAGTPARVYWESTKSLCAAELQSPDSDVQALVDFWRNGPGG